jgi:hypothetical protein
MNTLLLAALLSSLHDDLKELQAVFDITVGSLYRGSSQ